MPFRALAGCLAWVAGCWLALATGPGSPRLAVTLAATGLALRGRGGRCVALLAAGALRVWLLPLEVPGEATLARSRSPVTLRGTLVEGWSRGRFGWNARLRTRWLIRGGRVDHWRATVELSLAAAAEPPRHRALRVTGFLGRSPAPLNGPELPPGPWRLRVKSTAFLSGEWEGRMAGIGWPSGWRRRLAESGAGGGPRWGRALLLGSRQELERRAVAAFRSHGLAHLLAVSGLHLGIVAAPIAVAARGLPAGARWAPPLAASALYLLLVGPRYSLLRAAAMMVAVGVGWAAGRPAAPLQSLFRVAALIVALDPPALRDVGFRLTVAATAGVLASGKVFAAGWRRLPPVVARPLAATLGAQLFGLPWSLPVFRLLTPLAPLVNLLAVPWAAASLWASLVWASLALGWPGGVAAGWSERLLDKLAAPLELLPGLPSAALPLAASTPEALLLALLTGAVLAPVPARARAAAAAGLLALLLGWGLRRPGDRVGEIVVLDVGQGDATLLTGEGGAVLVDGGGWRGGDFGGRVLLPALLELGVRRLEAVVLSHPDLDHCGGLRDLAAFLPVAELWTASGWREPCARELVARAGPRLRVLWAGERAEGAGWRFEVLHPPAGARGGGNARSLVLAAERLGVRVLLPGDIDRAAESLLLREAPGRLGAQILKLPHHGSQTSSGASFLRAVGPRLAVVSAGWRNPYGHPAEEVLARLRRLQIPVLRTDRSGRIRLVLSPPGRFRVEVAAAGR